MTRKSWYWTCGPTAATLRLSRTSRSEPAELVESNRQMTSGLTGKRDMSVRVFIQNTRTDRMPIEHSGQEFRCESLSAFRAAPNRNAEPDIASLFSLPCWMIEDDETQPDRQTAAGGSLLGLLLRPLAVDDRHDLSIRFHTTRSTLVGVRQLLLEDHALKQHIGGHAELSGGLTQYM